MNENLDKTIRESVQSLNEKPLRNAPDFDKIWNRLEEKRFAHTHRNLHFRYAAAILLLALLCGSLFYWNFQQKKQLQELFTQKKYASNASLQKPKTEIINRTVLKTDTVVVERTKIVEKETVAYKEKIVRDTVFLKEEMVKQENLKLDSTVEEKTLQENVAANLSNEKEKPKTKKLKFRFGNTANSSAVQQTSNKRQEFALQIKL